MTASCPKTSPQTTAQARGAAAALAKQHNKASGTTSNPIHAAVRARVMLNCMPAKASAAVAAAYVESGAGHALWWRRRLSGGAL